MKSNSLCCGALLTAGLIFSAGQAALAVPVEFGTPDNLELGAAPLPAKATWGMSWDYRSSGHASEKLEISWETMELKASRIIPSTNGHAINTKGAGAQDRISFTDPLTGAAKRMHKPFVIDKGFDRLIQVEVEAGPENGTDNYLLLMEINISSPRGWTFASEPSIVVSSDFGSMIVVDNLAAPANDTSDPNLPAAVYQFSAVAVPEPTAVALVGVGGVVGFRRRSRA
jgi:hypothetical protein